MRSPPHLVAAEGIGGETAGSVSDVTRIQLELEVARRELGEFRSLLLSLVCWTAQWLINAALAAFVRYLTVEGLAYVTSLRWRLG